MSNQIATHDIDIGTILAGKYRIDQVLGRGGMGIVFKARHLELQDDFAIKVLQGREFGNPRSVERFLREARAAARLRSRTEHIVQVHDIGRIHSGEPYIVMEILIGQDLADLVTVHGRLPIAEACAYVMQACQALDAAHELGIIHRDLKPANLFLTRRRDGSPCIKVLDFGISKHVASEDDSTDVEITGTQDVMGSPLYMSPELAKAARNASPRSDIWALGAILYKLLTGKTPFPAPSPAELFAALLGPESAPKPSTLRPEIPPQLDAAILRCLEKNAKGRYSSVRELMNDLAPFGNASAVALVDNREIAPQQTQQESTGDDREARSQHREVSVNVPSRHVRRPSLVEPLPQGFALQPPPAPPRLSQQAGATPLPRVPTYSNVPPTALVTMIGSLATPTAASPSPVMASTSPDIMNDTRQTATIPEATGSTWGTTQSKLAGPRKARIRMLGGLAGIASLLMVALFGLVVKIVESDSSTGPDGVASFTPDAKPSSSSETPVVKPLETPPVVPLVVPPSASAKPPPVPESSSPTAPLVTPTVTKQPEKSVPNSGPIAGKKPATKRQPSSFDKF